MKDLEPFKRTRTFDVKCVQLAQQWLDGYSPGHYQPTADTVKAWPTPSRMSSRTLSTRRAVRRAGRRTWPSATRARTAKRTASAGSARSARRSSRKCAAVAAGVTCASASAILGIIRETPTKRGRIDATTSECPQGRLQKARFAGHRGLKARHFFRKGVER